MYILNEIKAKREVLEARFLCSKETEGERRGVKFFFKSQISLNLIFFFGIVSKFIKDGV